MPSLMQLNATLISKPTCILYAFQVHEIKDFLSFCDEICTQREERKVNYDYLNNEGYPIYDASRGLLLTGSDSTKNMLSKILSTKPVLILYPSL
jgi:hypothetical protein